MGRLPVYDVADESGQWRGVVAVMRRFLIGLVLVLLLIVSIGFGVTVARWPELLQSWRPQ